MTKKFHSCDICDPHRIKGKRKPAYVLDKSMWQWLEDIVAFNVGVLVINLTIRQSVDAGVMDNAYI